MKGWQLILDFNDSYYSAYLNKDNTRYSDLTNTFKYYYFDDDFRMDNRQMNVGVNYNFGYKNKKEK